MGRFRAGFAAVLFSSALVLGGCNVMKVFQSPDDKAITTEIQAKLFDDPVLKTRDIRVNSEKGLVTLTGTVSTDLEKAAAERIAVEASGVKSVLNQLMVSAAPAAAVPASEPAVQQAAEKVAMSTTETAPHKSSRRHERTAAARNRALAPPEEAFNDASSPGAGGPANEPAASPLPAQQQAATPSGAPSAPSAPPPRQPEHFTIPAGTVVTVRMIDGIDSQRNHPGDEFAGTVDAPIAVGDRVVIPRGSDVRVRLVQSQSAGRMTGRSELQLELVSVNAGGTVYNVESSRYEQRGASRGTRTAETIGGGAGLGALIGAIAGHGKGAAIGAAIGAGAGTAVQAGTRGQQVKVAPETKIDFTLKSPVTITL
jgi:hypothetical protein